MRLMWHGDSRQDYLHWQSQDKKTLKKINLLIQDIMRSPCEGIGKPEPLSGNLSGWWSRRIDEKNRIVYRAEEETIIILQCKGHYE